MKKISKQNFCCDRFEECVGEGEIEHSDDNDETEWFIPHWFHIYFCPFCGSFIKGNGFGVPTIPRTSDSFSCKENLEHSSSCKCEDSLKFKNKMQRDHK